MHTSSYSHTIAIIDYTWIGVCLDSLLLSINMKEGALLISSYQMASFIIHFTGHHQDVEKQNLHQRFGHLPLVQKQPLPPNKYYTSINHQWRVYSPGEGLGGLIF